MTSGITSSAVINSDNGRDSHPIRNWFRSISPLQILLSGILAICVSASLELRISTADDIRDIDAILATMADRAGGQRIATWCLVFVAVWAIGLFSSRVFVQAGVRERVIAGVSAALLSLTLLVPGVPREHATGVVPPWYRDASLKFLGSRRQIIIFVFQWISLFCFLFIVLTAFLSHVAVRSETVVSEAQPTSHLVWWRREIRKIRLCPAPVFAVTGIIALCWAPVFIINGPVSLPVDTMVQVIQFRGFPAWDPMLMKPLPGYWMTDHHPFFDSLIYGAFDELGLHLGHEMAGLVLLTILQGLLTAFAMSVALSWVASRFHMSDGLLLGMLLLICFMPGFASYETIIMKDSTWVPLYTLWLVFFAEYVYRIFHQQKQSGGVLTGLIALSIFAGLAKKTSIYVTTLAVLLLLPLRHVRWKTVIAALIPPIVVLLIVPAVLFPVLHIAKGGTQESLGLPMQQIGKAYIDDPNSFSKTDLKVINKVMDVSKIREKWEISTQDPIKQTIRSHVTRGDIIQFLCVWIKMFFRHPRSYISAISLSRNAFVAGDTYYTTGTVKCGWGPSGGYAVLPHYADCTPSWQQKHLGSRFVELMNVLPPFSVLGQECLYTAWIPLLCTAIIVDRRRYSRLNYLIPIYLWILVQLVIPAAQVRYSLGLLFGFMFALTAALGADRLQITKKPIAVDVQKRDMPRVGTDRSMRVKDSYAAKQTA